MWCCSFDLSLNLFFCLKLDFKHFFFYFFRKIKNFWFFFNLGFNFCLYFSYEYWNYLFNSFNRCFYFSYRFWSRFFNSFNRCFNFFLSWCSRGFNYLLYFFFSWVSGLILFSGKPKVSTTKSISLSPRPLRLIKIDWFGFSLASFSA